MTQPAHRFAFLFLAPLLAFIMAAAPLFAANRDRIEAFLTTTGFDVALESIALSSRSAPQMLGIDPDGFGSDWAVRARMREIAALNPHKNTGG